MKTKLVALGLFGFVLLGLIAALGTSRMWEAMSPTPSPQPTANQPNLTSQSVIREVGPVRNVRFILFDAGIQPYELRTSAGLISISIEDKTKSTAGLVIRRIIGIERIPVGEVRRVADHWRGRTLLRLPTGRYEVHDATKPTNKATLIVTP